jgi:hypothetical protein
MTLASSGAMALGGPTVGRSVNLELNFSGTAPITMNDFSPRILAEKNTNRSQISMSDFYGKDRNTAPVALTLSWSTSQSGLVSTGGWAISNQGRTIRFNVENDAFCGGINPNTQSGTATATIVTGAQGYRFVPTMVGMGEQEDPGYDAMYLYFNGSQLVYARAPGGNLGCVTSAPVVQVPSSIPFQTLAPNSSYSFVADFSTLDELYHINCYYELNLAFYLP